MADLGHSKAVKFIKDVEITSQLDVDNINIDGNTISATNDSGLALYDNAATGIYIADGGNVGLGTTSLTNSNFKIDRNNSAIDQQQTSSSNVWTTTDIWQSFTTGYTGYLTQVDWYRISTSGATTGTFSIRTGEGTGGTLLYSDSVSIDNTVGWKSKDLTNNPPYLSASTKYTVRWQVTGNSDFGAQSGDLYPGGRGSQSSTFDLRFRTHMATNLAQYVINNLGYLGLRNLNPAYPLDLIGNAQIDGYIKIGTGSNSIFIKNKKLTGTTNASASETIVSGVILGKIISVNPIVYVSGVGEFQPNYTTTSNANYYSSFTDPGGNIVLNNKQVNILNRPYRITIWYEE